MPRLAPMPRAQLYKIDHHSALCCMHAPCAKALLERSMCEPQCPLWVDGVDKIADERVEASVLERLARDFDPIFSTLRLERDYIDAADRN